MCHKNCDRDFYHEKKIISELLLIQSTSVSSMQRAFKGISKIHKRHQCHRT